ncbi:peptidoglycan-binding protein [Pyxidicoccus parkwayensis]|uniref:Peptidoglycan-binding protein n=1 Tax=Pyxidicoccus parkwayensis TaxID=2813578 RepID=A0ABX7P5B3_9BACT|nr:glycoside hydrolase family 19 protein [Pyxidicoccus parkwaysis]QSQ25637.1 peptidoglycan-binding protein [Pyxidicoccus parkwaysis]
MSSVGGTGGSGGSDSASRAESARAEAARAEASRQAEASRKAAEDAAKAEAAKQAAVRNQFNVDSFTPAAAAKAPVNLNPSPVSVQVAQAQTVDAARSAEAAQSAKAEQAKETQQADASKEADFAKEAKEADEADATEAANEAAAADVAQAAKDAEATEATQDAEAAQDAQATEAAEDAQATDEAQAAEQAQTPTVTQENIDAALAELPDVELNRNPAGTQPTAEVTAQNQQVQTALRELGMVAAAHVTGFYGSITEGAIKSFQHEQGLTVTGTYDAATRTAMANELAERRAAEAQGITAPAATLPDTYTAVTDQQLQDIMPDSTQALRDQYLDSLNTAMEEFNISTPERQAAFLSQVAAETGDLHYMSEITPNPAHGDYYGRGMLQLTHETNYRQAGTALGADLTTNPNQVATDADLAARTAGWYFDNRGLNRQADLGHIGAVTLGVNGGYNGIDRRLEAYDEALRVLGQ